MADLLYVSQYFTTTLAVVGGINNSQTDSIVFQDVSGIDQPTKPGLFLLNYSDPLNESIAEWCTYTSVNTTTKEAHGVVRGAEKGSAKAHDNGVTVAFPLSESHINRINDKLTGADTGVTTDDQAIHGTPTFDDEAAAVIYRDSLSRQALNNSNFDVWQRGTTGTPADSQSVFTADRWKDVVGKDSGTLPTLSRTKQTLTSGDIANAFYYSRLTTNGAGTSLGVSSYHQYAQHVEHGVRLLCGLNKKVTISFWARSDISNKKLGVAFAQNYGTGGSPSAQEWLPASTISLTSTWTKYTFTTTTNTLVGKTFGTANDDVLRVIFYIMWGSTTGSTVGLTGTETYVGAGYVDIAQVQLCAGDVALPFQPKSYEEELRVCKRYCRGYTVSGFEEIGQGSAGSTTVAYITVPFDVEMRTTPSLVATASEWSLIDHANAAVDVTVLAMDTARDTKYQGVVNATVASGLTQYRVYGLAGDNGGTRTLYFDAEL